MVCLVCSKFLTQPAIPEELQEYLQDFVKLDDGAIFVAKKKDNPEEKVN